MIIWGQWLPSKKETGAKLYADEADVDALKSGGKSDYELGKYGVTFKPVNPDYILKDQNVVTLGDTKLTMLHHPGHTKGSCSFLFETKDSKRSYKVLIANMPTIIIDKSFLRLQHILLLKKIMSIL